jgi:hypothetical protein
MQPPELGQDYFFEFAGMPQSGKSTIEEIVAHYLAREGFALEEYRGGSRYSPLRFSPVDELNTLLACRVVKFVLSAAGREKAQHKIFLLDRGLIDRYLFTETLLRQGQMDEATAYATKLFLTSPQLLRNISGVFVFLTSPELAVQRENAYKLVATEGDIMNTAFLTAMRTVIEDELETVETLLPKSHVQRIDTTEGDGKVAETARGIVNIILRITQQPNKISARR